jgi:hypothetical protein
VNDALSDNMEPTTDNEKKTVYFYVYMDTKEQVDMMMCMLIGKNQDVIRGISKTYNVRVYPSSFNCLTIIGHRNDVLRAHESLSRGYSHRKKWIIAKYGTK